MAYDSLKNIIRQYIKTNGEQEITGQIMQNVLIEMVNNYPSTEGCIRATLSNLANGDILVYDSVGAWYNVPMSSFLAGYATQLWVNQQGYVTSSALAGYIHPTLTDLANGDILIWDSVGSWVNAPLDTTISGFGYVKSTGSVAYATSAGSANILGHSVYENPAHALANGDMLVYDSGTGWTNVETSSILSGYATQSWVTSQGYITASALNGYATQSWVTSQGYIQPTLSNLSNGDILIYDSVGAWYNTSLSSFFNGYATQSWVNTQLAGYLPLTGGTLTGSNTFLNFKSTTANCWIQFNSNNVIKAACGYYLGLGCITNEVTNSARIGVYDDGTPQYWPNATGNLKYTLWHTGNLSNVSQLTNDAGYITASGSCAYATSAGSANILGHTVYENQAHSLANGDMLVYDSGTGWTNVETSSILSGYATQSWVTSQGYITSSALAGYIHPTLTNLANGDILIYDSVGAWVNTNLNTTVAGFGYITSSALAGYLPLTGGTLTGELTVPNIFLPLLDRNSGNTYGQLPIACWKNNDSAQGFQYVLAKDLYAGGILPNQNNAVCELKTSTFWNPITSYTQIWQEAFGLTDNGDRGAIIFYLRDSIYDPSITYKDLCISIDGDYFVRSWKVYHEGNFSPSDYLPVTGGTITGAATVNNYVLGIKTTSNYDWASTLDVHAPNLSTGRHVQFNLGVANSNYNEIALSFYYAGSESTNNRAGIGFYNAGELFVVRADGNVGIGTISPAYKLHVNGTANATTLYQNGNQVIDTSSIGSQSVNFASSANILGHSVTLNSAHSMSNGDILVYDSAGTWTNVSSGLSDIRQKDVINYNAEPTFEAVANAPAIKFIYKDNTYSFRRGIHIGSIAQYWQTTLPETVSMDNEGMLSMKYDVIALLSTISVAKKVSEHERRIVILERENEELRKELAALKSA